MFFINTKEIKENKKIKKEAKKEKKRLKKAQKIDLKNLKKEKKLESKKRKKVLRDLNLTEEKIQKRNLRLFVLYKMLSYDLLFYYIVSFLFFTEIKGMSASDVLFYEAFYPFFKLFFEPIIVTFIDSKPKKTCLITANFLLFLAILTLLLSSSPLALIPANLFMAIGFAIKDQVESIIAYDFIGEKNLDKKRSLFLKIDGKATSKYHILSATSSLLSSVLYVFNPYIPFILSATMLFMATILCFFFNIKEKSEKISVLKDFKNYFIELKESFNFINHSNRLTYLIVFNGLFHGIYSTMVSFRSSLLTDINISTPNRGILFAIFSLIAFNSSKKANNIHHKFRNRTLSTFANIYFLLILSIGLSAYPSNLTFISYFLLFTLMSCQFIIEGPYRSIINQYLSNFTNEKISSKIFSITGFITQLFSLTFMLLSSLLLKYFPTAICLIFIGSIAYITFTILLEFMRKKVGLKPYEYTKTEIFID